MPASDWEEQWARVRRWYERFHEHNTGQAESEGTGYVQEVAYAFFQSSHHLKDWLAVSGVVDYHDVEGFIRRSPNLRIGAGLSNATKHLGRDNRRKGRPDARVTGGSVEITVPSAGVMRLPDGSLRPIEGRGGSNRTSFTVTSEGRPHDAPEVAAGCMQEWWGYLRERI